MSSKLLAREDWLMTKGPRAKFTADRRNSIGNCLSGQHVLPIQRENAMALAAARDTRF